MATRYLALFCLLIVVSCGRSAAAAEADSSADEQFLRAARISLDSPSLLQIFRCRTPDEATEKRVQRLIAQLGDDEFQVREAATSELSSLGVVAAGLLREAAHHRDLETRRRARHALFVIERDELSVDVLLSALRILAQRKPAGLTTILLDYAPHAPGEEITEELCGTLTAVACRDGQADPRLVRALTDKVPARRGTAAVVLCRARCREQLPALRRLLRDPDLLVRQRVGLALLEERERAAIPVLIDLLAQLPLAEADRVEMMLLHLAGEAAPDGQLDEPKTYRSAWAEWWKQHGDNLDLAKIEFSPQWRGYTLAICRTTIRGRGGRLGRPDCILELDAQGHVRWQMKGLSFPVDAQILNEKRVLVAEFGSLQVTERNHNGDVLRRLHFPEPPLEARRLPNGHTLITTHNRVFEIDRNDKEVWTTKGDLQLPAIIVAACPLPGREIGICCQTGQFVRVDRNGKTLASFRVGSLFRPNGTHIQGLPNGHILVPLLYDNKVVEFDKNGRQVWSASYSQPNCAQRLPNGRTLIASYGSNFFAEVDKNGREVKNQRCDAPMISVRQR